MSSRERILMAIGCREPDHVPLLNRGGIPHRYWSTRGRRGTPFGDQFERVVESLKLGIDDAVALHPPFHLSEDVKVRIRKEKTPTENYPLLIKEYETPKGTLSKVVHQTPDWPHGDDIPLFDDYAVSSARPVKYMVEGDKDLEALSCLVRHPNGAELRAFGEEAERVKRFAEGHGVPIVCVEDANLGSAAMWLCGFINTMMATFRNQGFLHRLLDIIHRWDMMKVRSLLEVGRADVIVHYGWYDSTDFWTTRAYRDFLLPRLREEIELVHKHDAKFGYTMASGAMPLLGTFKEMGVDLLYGIDPVQGGYDLERAKREIGGEICLWGGVNSHVTLTNGSMEDVRAAVKEAFSKLAPGGGFILSSVGTMEYPQIPAENIGVMIEAWREATGCSQVGR
jgi:hypothetical protein